MSSEQGHALFQASRDGRPVGIISLNQLLHEWGCIGPTIDSNHLVTFLFVELMYEVRSCEHLTKRLWTLFEFEMSASDINFRSCLREKPLLGLESRDIWREAAELIFDAGGYRDQRLIVCSISLLRAFRQAISCWGPWPLLTETANSI